MGLIAAIAALVVVLATGRSGSAVAGAPPPRPSHQVQPSAPATPAARTSVAPVAGPPPAARAAGALVSELQAGVMDGQVTRGAGQNLFNQLQQILFQTAGNAEQVEQQYSQLVESYDQLRSQGQISAGAAVALRRSIAALGTALGAS